MTNPSNISNSSPAEAQAEPVDERAASCVERAAEMLAGYIQAIKSNGQYEYWHYIPEVEGVIDELRALAPAQRAGWKLAPIEPTAEMEDAAMRAITACDEDFRDPDARTDFRVSYREALAAIAPAQPVLAETLPLDEWAGRLFDGFSAMMASARARCNLDEVALAKSMRDSFAGLYRTLYRAAPAQPPQAQAAHEYSDAWLLQRATDAQQRIDAASAALTAAGAPAVQPAQELGESLPVVTHQDQIDAEQTAHEWLSSMVPAGRESVFWSLERKRFAEPSEGGSVSVLRHKGRARAACICIRDDFNRTNLIRWTAGAPAQAPQEQGMVLAPHYRGYAHLGSGEYALNNSAAGDPPELIISIASEEYKAGRTVGDVRPNEPGSQIQPDEMAVRIRFDNLAGLDALEQQLRFLREEHFPQAPQAVEPLDGAGERS